MRTVLFRGRTVIVASLALILWLPALPPTQAADQSLALGAGTSSQERPQAISDARSLIPSGAPVVGIAVGIAPGQATWVNDIANALGFYFKENYPTDDFTPYVKKLTLAQNALDRGDRRTVQVEMGAFLKLLANRSYGISEGAADELTNFARMVMPVQEDGIFFPRSRPEEDETPVLGPGF